MLNMRFFFFKQKTAYEMRISDWSSDVCSSDLRTRATSPLQCAGSRRLGWRLAQWLPEQRGWARCSIPGSLPCSHSPHGSASPARSIRSEEHTSELQSLMRISYAVFCLKKNNNQQNVYRNPIHEYTTIEKQ